MKTMRKAIAVVLCVIMLLTVIPFLSVSALENATELTIDVFTSLKLKGDSVNLSFTAPEDGFYKFYSTGKADTYAELYDSQDNLLCENDDVYSDSYDYDYNFTINYKLSAGQTYYLSVNAYESAYVAQNAKVKVTKISGIESAIITKMPNDTTCIEDYEEMSTYVDGLAIDYTFSDCSVVNWSADSGDWYVKDFAITWDGKFDEAGNYFVEVNCAGVITRIDYTKIENPVDYIEYVGDDIECFENSGGYYNENLGYYYYYLSFPSNSYVAIHYKDGSVKNAKIGSKVGEFRVECYTTQMDEAWSVGENTAYVYFMGVEAEVKVNILPPPFKSITLNRVPTKEYVYGDMRFGTLNENLVYEFEPNDISGLSFTVEYHDGTKRTFFDKDFDIKNGTIDGYEYSVSQCKAAVPKTCTTTLSFMGYELKYNVKVVESPIKNLEVVWYPDLTDYEESYAPVFDGMEIEVSYKDGTKKTVVLSDENTSYGENGWFNYRFNTGTEEISVMQGWDYMGEPIYIFCCYDQFAEYSGIAFYEDEKVDSISLCDFSFENMTIDVNYANGSKEKLEGRIVNLGEYEEGRYGAYVKTQKGILTARIDTLYENEEISGYEITALGKSAQVSGRLGTKGDVDLNDEINVLDATKIQRYLSRYEQLSELQLDVADADEDGAITVMDVTHIQRYVAKQIDKI